MCDWIEKDAFAFPDGQERFIYIEKTEKISQRSHLLQYINSMAQLLALFRSLKLWIEHQGVPGVLSQ
jgi:hypothetical protein